LSKGLSRKGRGKVEDLRPDAVRQSVEALCAAEPKFRAIEERFGPCPLRLRDPGFPALVRIIIGQQVSVAAASSIYAKLEAAGGLQPDFVARASDEALRACGLSIQKIRTCRGIAAAVLDGELDFDGLIALSDEDAIAQLTTLKGVGQWTAEIYLLGALGRSDVWPAGDLGIQAAVHRFLALRRRPDAKATLRHGEKWRPWRSAAARLLWHYLAGAKMPV
jgi:DNA-3-methyladenine glycosylase II